MLEKDANHAYSLYSILAYLWMGALAWLGCLAHYVHTLEHAKGRFSLVDFSGQLVISSFAGLVTFYLSNAAQINADTQAALVAISGHMGNQAVATVENRCLMVLERFFPSGKSK